MSSTTRVPGHELQSEGAPYQRGTRRGTNIRVRALGTYTTAGIGYGLCSCGAHSEVLTSGRARKHWHRQHKLKVTAAADQ